MLDHATAQQIATYREAGFVVVRDLLAPGELAELAAGVERGLAEARRTLGTNKVVGGDWHEGTDPYRDAVFVQRVNLWKIEPTVRRYLLGPEIGRIAVDLAGVAGLRCWHDQTLQKAPWANPTNWHLDHPYYSYHQSGTISAWIALDDATVANGCLWYLPGSHRLLVDNGNPDIGNSMGDLLAAHPELAGLEAVPAPVPAGSCVFHDGLVAHAAGPNMTPRWRRAMTCAYMPIGATYNGQPNILAADRLARLRVGDSLDDDAENPLVYALPGR